MSCCFCTSVDQPRSPHHEYPHIQPASPSSHKRSRNIKSEASRPPRINNTLSLPQANRTNNILRGQWPPASIENKGRLENNDFLNIIQSVTNALLKILRHFTNTKTTTENNINKIVVINEELDRRRALIKGALVRDNFTSLPISDLNDLYRHLKEVVKSDDNKDTLLEWLDCSESDFSNLTKTFNIVESQLFYEITRSTRNQLHETLKTPENFANKYSDLRNQADVALKTLDNIGINRVRYNASNRVFELIKLLLHHEQSDPINPLSQRKHNEYLKLFEKEEQKRV